MSELDYIGPSELIFNNDDNNGIHSGGFSVNSIMMKSKISPIMTVNKMGGGEDNEKVSELFNDLVVPNWALSYNNRIFNSGGGSRKRSDDDDTDTDDDVITDDLHDKLLELVKQHNDIVKQQNNIVKNKGKKLTKKKTFTLGKKTRRLKKG